MLYSPHQAVPPMPFGPFRGTYGGKAYEESGELPHALSDQQKKFMEEEHIRHILMITVQNAETAAKWSNALQARAEALPHGIPVNISSDPRNGARGNTGMEFKTGGSDVSKWPEGVGFAACFDPAVVRQFAEDASREYRALGITTALGPQIDLCTEPRWMRFVDTLGENLEMTKKLVKAYCDGMQTTQGSGTGWGATASTQWSSTGRAAAPARAAATRTTRSANTRSTRPATPPSTGSRLRRRPSSSTARPARLRPSCRITRFRGG